MKRNQTQKFHLSSEENFLSNLQSIQYQLRGIFVSKVS